ncbi:MULTISPECIES: alpha/beta fold hydrolase [Nocardia]|uniref:alpha/beta fold hydrolase n=1 Tax=Nocardia TaxID=1817 RepID=UPI001892EA4F|nr:MULTISPECIES: alpha/beta hydrolase [Nocardia]MBF6348980.1 alpha/beta hydrolase [Nocardia flavorosea]
MTSAFERCTDLTIGGGPIRHYRSGDQGPPVLLLHGGMMDTAEGVWRDIAHRMAAKYQVHAIDLPRHGASRPWPGRLDRQFFDRFLDDLVDSLQLPVTAIVGLSLGGGLGIGYALRNPGRVSALIAIGPGGLGAKRRAQFATWALMRTPGVLTLTSKYLARNPETVRRSLITNLTAGAATADFGVILELVRAEAQAKARFGEPALDDWMVDAYGPRRMRWDYLTELDRLAVPSLWIRGENDPLVGHPELAAAAAAAPGGRFAAIPEAGHIVTYDQPAEFFRLADEFLTSAVGGRAAG